MSGRANERQGDKDLWSVYEANYPRLRAAQLEASLANPQLAALFGDRRRDLASVVEDAPRETLKRAVLEGAWDPYAAELRGQGALYAKAGIDFDGWYAVIGTLEGELTPLLVQEYRDDEDRLLSALAAVRRLLNRVMSVVGKSYMETKDALLEEERQRVAASRDQYQMLFDASPLPMWLIDRETLGFLLVNDAAARHYGLSRDELKSMTLKDVRSPEEIPQLMEDMAKPAHGASRATRRHRKKDGTRITVDVSAFDLTFNNRASRLVVMNDVTEKLRLEDQLRQSQKMEAVGRLAGGVAHDFNNLLTVILSYGRFLRDDLGPAHASRADAEEVIKAAERAAGLTRQLLAFSRRQIADPQVVNLNDIVANAGRMLTRLIGEDVDLVTVPASGLGSIRADPGHVEQVLMNLVVNARDAMPGGGKLTVETANVDLDETYVKGHLDARAGSYVMLAVTDTGVGMDEATLARIFEPFFTTKAVGRGTGLGLATVFGIVKQAGGDIQVYSAKGRGTTFKVYLPRVSGLTELATGKDSETPRGTETVLLVEDDAAVRAVARRTLTAYGYVALEAARPEDAIRICAERKEHVDLVVTDVVMPQMNGRELADRLAARYPGLKVLFMSGYTGGAMVHQGIVASGAPFLQKPFTPEAFAEKVRNAIDGKGATREAA